MAPEVAAINRNAAEPEAEVRQIAREAAWAMVGVLGVPNGPAPTAHVFRAIAESSVRLDMVTRRASTFGPNCFDLLFALPAADVDKTVHTLGWERDTIEFAALRREDRMGKVSMTGSGLRKQPSFVASFFAVLSSAGVAVELSSVSDSCISVVCDSMATGTAVDALRFVYRPQPMSGRP